MTAKLGHAERMDILNETHSILNELLDNKLMSIEKRLIKLEQQQVGGLNNFKHGD